MTDVLLTNDDGYKSAGFFPLLKGLSKGFSVVAVAPSEEKSWIGKAITAWRELELKEVEISGNKMLSLDGTPADCVQIGLYGVLDKKPKLVVSGINTGDNLGHGRILSSGTVGAAMEASIDGVKSLASSLYIPPEIKKITDFNEPKNYKLFENAAKITVKLAKIIIDKELCDGVDLICLNIPFNAKADAEFEVTRPFRAPYGKLFNRKGNKFAHVNPPLEFKHLKEGTDLKALSEGKVSIAPISLELASKESVEKIRRAVEKEW